MPTRESARRFHFLREIASGGFGSVYLCKVVHADGFSRLAAVKLLKAQWSDNEEIVHRIRDEARLLGLLRHRNIVDVMDLTSIDGRTAVVMEYLEAVDFRMVIAELNRQGKRIPVKAVLEAMAAVAGALDAAYNRPPIPGEKPLRVIHRDIKPSNIMLDETGMVKVLDFENGTRVYSQGEIGDYGGRRVAVSMREISPDVMRSTSGRRQAEMNLVLRLSRDIVKLFYEHETRDLGENLGTK